MACYHRLLRDLKAVVCTALRNRSTGGSCYCYCSARSVGGVTVTRCVLLPSVETLCCGTALSSQDGTSARLLLLIGRTSGTEDSTSARLLLLMGRTSGTGAHHRCVMMVLRYDPVRCLSYDNRVWVSPPIYIATPPTGSGPTPLPSLGHAYTRALRHCHHCSRYPHAPVRASHHHHFDTSTCRHPSLPPPFVSTPHSRTPSDDARCANQAHLREGLQQACSAGQLAPLPPGAPVRSRFQPRPGRRVVAGVPSIRRSRLGVRPTPGRCRVAGDARVAVLGLPGAPPDEAHRAAPEVCVVCCCCCGCVDANTESTRQYETLSCVG